MPLELNADAKNEPEMPEQLKAVIRQEPRVLVKLEAMTDDAHLVKHEYVVQMDDCQTALQVGWLARTVYRVHLTRIYAKEETTRPLDPFLASYPDVIFYKE